MSGRELFDTLMRAARRSHSPPRPLPLRRCVRPSVDRFAELRRAGLPVVLHGLTDDWPGRADLTLARLRERFGDRLVSGSPTRNGQVRLDVVTGVSFEPVRFGDYLDRLARGDWPESYLHGAGREWLPELERDVRLPEYCRHASWQTWRFWVSAPEMSSPLHYHVAENLFFQLVGRKRFSLYPPPASPWLYANPLRSALPNYSRFDPEHPDYERFPLSRALQPLEMILEPGEAIYLPSSWWHQVRSLEVSFSLNFFFADGMRALAQRITEIGKRVRGLETYGLRRRLHSNGRDGTR